MKSLMEEEISSGTERESGWVELESPDSLKPLPTRWENTERIASLNSYS